jgi:hypothetical protein
MSRLFSNDFNARYEFETADSKFIFHPTHRASSVKTVNHECSCLINNQTIKLATVKSFSLSAGRESKITNIPCHSVHMRWRGGLPECSHVTTRELKTRLCKCLFNSLLWSAPYIRTAYCLPINVRFIVARFLFSQKLYSFPPHITSTACEGMSQKQSSKTSLKVLFG